jgi:hypothetical protein
MDIQNVDFVLKYPILGTVQPLWRGHGGPVGKMHRSGRELLCSGIYCSAVQVSGGVHTCLAASVYR